MYSNECVFDRGKDCETWLAPQYSWVAISGLPCSYETFIRLFYVLMITLGFPRFVMKLAQGKKWTVKTEKGRRHTQKNEKKRQEQSIEIEKGR